MIKKIFDNIMNILLIILLGSGIYLVFFLCGYLNKEVPFDDLRTNIESIQCNGKSCNITFNSEVIKVYQAKPTGSMIPVIGGQDYIVCINSTPKIGDIVVTPNYVHFLKEIKGQWGITRGFNNDVLDGYMTPLEDMYVVALVGR